MTESSSTGTPDGVRRAHGPASDGPSDGHPDRDRREEILEPSPGARGHRAESIRDEQGIHEAGAVPAAFDGDGTADGPDGAGRPRHPEDALSEHDAWDGGSAGR
ncbi:hypothetical protein [Arthrobacter sp. TMS2-4]